MSGMYRLRIIILRLAYCIGFIVITHAHADDSQNSEQLHNQHCLKCHDAKMYQRPDSFIKNYDMLDQQIKRCEVPAEAQWSPSQIIGVTDYLNSQFYKFDKPK